MTKAKDKKLEYLAYEHAADNCAACGRQISSSRQISKPGTMICDQCAKVDLHEEER